MSDFNSLVGTQTNKIERRDFIKAAGVGFAAAALPVSADTIIQTDTIGLSAKKFNLSIAGKDVPVYTAQPEGKKNLPIVIVVSEIFGLHEHIQDVVRRFAKQGYLALAPDLFVRQGDPMKYDSIAKLLSELISKVPDAQVLGDIDACVKWAGENNGDPKKMGITGFCWGGRITWLYAAHNPAMKAGVAWYGKLNGDNATVKNPIDYAATLKVPVLGLYGAKDTGISLESVEQMKQALAKGDSKSEIVVYPNSGHAFHADYRPSYVEADAKDGWQRCLKWLASHGVS